MDWIENKLCKIRYLVIQNAHPQFQKINFRILNNSIFNQSGLFHVKKWCATESLKLFSSCIKKEIFCSKLKSKKYTLLAWRSKLKKKQSRERERGIKFPIQQFRRSPRGLSKALPVAASRHDDEASSLSPGTFHPCRWCQEEEKKS